MRSALHRLSFRPYWGRMWTVQEFILPKNLLLLCGEHGACWENFLAAKPSIAEMQLLQSGWLRLWDARDRWQRSNAHRDGVVEAVAEELHDAVVDHRPDSGTTSALTAAGSLDELLFAFGYGQCSDPRDRMYALLSLVRHRGSQSPRPLLPDYTISAEQLYYRVLAHLRSSPSLADNRSWTDFRGVLCRALELDKDEEYFRRHDTLYEVTGDKSRQGVDANFRDDEVFQYFLWLRSHKKTAYSTPIAQRGRSGSL